ncbi:hypothetical protein CL6EHI_152740 [Entamoeba histolytica]|nr:hypothetical protein CL6EHI_152740 [Entamoeba histolytica]
MKTSKESSKTKKRGSRSFCIKNFTKKSITLFRLHSSSDTSSEECDDAINSVERMSLITSIPSITLESRSFFKPLEKSSSEILKLSSKPQQRRSINDQYLTNYLSPNVHNEKPIYRLVERIGFIRRNIGIKTEKIIFDSNQDGLDNRILSSKVFGKESILFICIADGIRFGCFHKDIIAPFNKCPSNEFYSKGSFIFFIKDNISVCETILKRLNKNQPNIELHYCPEKDTVFSCINAFTIKSNGDVNLSELITHSFDCKEIQNILSLTFQRSSIVCKRLLAIQFE